DDAEVPIVIPGPGVGTPGFWLNNGKVFWDGIVGNESKAGQPGFADGELLPAGQTYILLGDDNNNGVTDGTEDTLKILTTDALKFLHGGGANKVDLTPRDAIAPWLNFEAGNNDGSGPGSPADYMDKAIDWLQL